MGNLRRLIKGLFAKDYRVDRLQRNHQGIVQYPKLPGLARMRPWGGVVSRREEAPQKLRDTACSGPTARAPSHSPPSLSSISGPRGLPSFAPCSCSPIGREPLGGAGDWQLERSVHRLSRQLAPHPSQSCPAIAPAPTKQGRVGSRWHLRPLLAPRACPSSRLDSWELPKKYFQFNIPGHPKRIEKENQHLLSNYTEYHLSCLEFYV